MKSKLLRKLAKSQKYLILAEIKRSQGLSVSQLCERINLSYMGVKQHCVALEKDGYLDTWRRPKGMGRPEKAYRLTPSAQEFFPSEHTNFPAEVSPNPRAVFGPRRAGENPLPDLPEPDSKMQGRVSGSTLEERAR